MPDHSNKLFIVKDLDLKSLNNAMAEELMIFDSDSSHLCLYSCVAGGLTDFKRDFIKGSYAQVAERSSDITTGKATTIGEGIAVYTFKDDARELCTLKTHMAYAPSSKNNLM